MEKGIKTQKHWYYHSMEERFSRPYRELGIELSPEDLRSLKLYVLKGVDPGGFWYGVLTNDLQETFAHADEYFAKKVPAIVKFIYNEMPSVCWGSESIVNSWLSCGGLSSYEE